MACRKRTDVKQQNFSTEKTWRRRRIKKKKKRKESQETFTARPGSAVSHACFIARISSCLWVSFFTSISSTWSRSLTTRSDQNARDPSKVFWKTGARCHSVAMHFLKKCVSSQWKKKLFTGQHASKFNKHRKNAPKRSAKKRVLYLGRRSWSIFLLTFLFLRPFVSTFASLFAFFCCRVFGSALMLVCSFAWDGSCPFSENWTSQVQISVKIPLATMLRHKPVAVL